MIGKITTSHKFAPLFNYLLQESKKARIINGFCLSRTSEKLSQEFTAIAQTRPTTTKPVKHLIIAFAPQDGQVSDRILNQIAAEVVNGLGYSNNQWIAIAHHRNDPGHDWKHDHDHMHIVVNTIGFDGKRISDSFDKTKLETILRQLEQQYELTPVPPSKLRRHKFLKNQEFQQFKRETKEYYQGTRSKPAQLPALQKLQAAIDAVSRDRPTFTTFIARLQIIEFLQ
jgi:hypothetical protein